MVLVSRPSIWLGKSAANSRCSFLRLSTIDRKGESIATARPCSLAKVSSLVVDPTGNEQLQGEAELFFAHLEPGEGVPKLFEPDELLKWLDHMHIYDIGQDEAGNPLTRPDW